VRFRSTAQRSRLHHTGAIDERVAEAIAARLGGPVIAADGEEDVALVHARFERDEVTLSLDTSGAPLHRRGYRLATAKAPLREDLARALVITSGWDRRSPLVDPMAGSGTIAIEAAMLARGIAPGRARRFAFEDAPTHDAALLARLRDEADERAGVSSGSPARIVARDRDEGAVTAARANAERAGVMLEHVVAPLSEPFAIDTDEGALVTNPPWGVRVARDRDLRPLYDRLGALIDALPPRWEAGVVAADADLVRRAHMPLRSALLTDAGGTKVRFYRRAREE
jgi:putative N6-adenine-specific DNA methylase